MAQLMVIALIVVSAGGFWRFWGGFKKTNFSRRLLDSLILSFLWPS